MLPAYSTSARAIKMPARFREDEVLLYSEDFAEDQQWLPPEDERGRESHDREHDGNSVDRPAVAPPLVRGPTPLDQQIALHQRNPIISGKTPQQLQIEAFYNAPPRLQVEALAAGTTAAATAAAAASTTGGEGPAGLRAYQQVPLPRPLLGAEQVNYYYEQRQAQHRAYQLDLQRQRRRNQERFRLRQLQQQQQQQLTFNPFGRTFDAIPEEQSTTLADSDLFLNDNPSTGSGNGQSFEDAMRIVAPELAHNSDDNSSFAASFYASGALSSSYFPDRDRRRKGNAGDRRTNTLSPAKASSSSSTKSLGPCTSFQPNCYCKTGRSRPVERYDPETGETLERYCGIPDASRKLNLKYNNIMTHLHKRKAHVDGHYFRYEFNRTKSSSGGGGGGGDGGNFGGHVGSSGGGTNGATAELQTANDTATGDFYDAESSSNTKSSSSISLGSIKGIKVRAVNQGSSSNGGSGSSTKISDCGSGSSSIFYGSSSGEKLPALSLPSAHTPVSSSSPSLSARAPLVKKSPGGGAAAKTATALEVDEALARGPNQVLVAHFLHFSLCQLRAQADRCLDQGTAFDEALSSINQSSSGSSKRSVSSQKPTEGASIDAISAEDNANNTDTTADAAANVVDSNDDDDDSGMSDLDDDNDVGNTTNRSNEYSNNGSVGTNKVQKGSTTTLSLADQFYQSVKAVEEEESKALATTSTAQYLVNHHPTNNAYHDDVAACQPLMDLFFAGPALGDKWVPWSTALGSHELYIAQRIYGLKHLSDEEHYLLHFCFRGSSYEPCFEAVFAPLFEAPGADQPGHPNHARWKQVLHDPQTAFAVNGMVHKRFLRYRRLGGGEQSGSSSDNVDFMSFGEEGECDEEDIQREEPDESSLDAKTSGGKRRFVPESAAARAQEVVDGANMTTTGAAAASAGKIARKGKLGRTRGRAAGKKAGADGKDAAGTSSAGVSSALLESVASRKRARAWELSVLAGTVAWEVGAAVEVLHCGAWFSAQVVALVPAGIKVHYHGGAVATVAVIRTVDVAVRLRAPQNATANNDHSHNSNSKGSSDRTGSSSGNSSENASKNKSTNKHSKTKDKNNVEGSSNGRSNYGSSASSSSSSNTSDRSSSSSPTTIGGLELAELPPWRTAPFPPPLPSAPGAAAAAGKPIPAPGGGPPAAVAADHNEGKGNVTGEQYKDSGKAVNNDCHEKSSSSAPPQKSRKNSSDGDNAAAVSAAAAAAAAAAPTTPSNAAAAAGAPPPLGKLHTSAYRAAPPKGASGDAFTWWICDRARSFIEVGREAYAKLQDMRQRIQPTKKSARNDSNNRGGDSSSSSNSSSNSSNNSRRSASSSNISLNVGTAADGLCSLLCQHKGLGPTMSKMFLVTTHLRYPELELLDHSCQVGDGAEPALALLYDLMGPPSPASLPSPSSPVASTALAAASTAEAANSLNSDSANSASGGATAVGTKKPSATNLFPRETTLRLRPEHREQLLRGTRIPWLDKCWSKWTTPRLNSSSGLHAHLLQNADVLEPRLLPMVRWVVERTREHLAGSVPEDSLPLGIAVFELQVNLCEWRKMLTQVDTSRCMKRGVTASEVLKAARKAGTGGGGGTGGDHDNNSSSNGNSGSNAATSRVGKRLPFEAPTPTGC